MYNKIKYSILCLLFIIEIRKVISHRCKADKIKSKPKRNKHMKQKTEIRYLQNQIWEPLRIHVDYTYLNSQSGFDENSITFVKNVIDYVINIYSNLLLVKRSSQKITLKEDCEMITISSMNLNITTTGIDTDLIIFPFFDIFSEESYESYAMPCSLNPNNNRPISGLMAINPDNFLTNYQNSFEYYSFLIMHEFNHILCFNQWLFDFFIDPNTNKAIGYDKVVKNILVNGLNRTVIFTPKVLETARNYFGCSSLEGVELENQDEEGITGSHWEARIMLGDFMVGETYQENIISEITLALFEDSGWYKVNYYTGGIFKHGKNQGCDFLKNKCIIDSKSNFPAFFCDTEFASTCFSSRTAKGYCGLWENLENIGEEYRYFNSTNQYLAGHSIADFCPVAQWEYDHDMRMFFSSSCLYGLEYYKDFGEKIGINSACFISSLVPFNFTEFEKVKGVNRAVCYPYSCNDKNRTYDVTILNITINCPKEGGIRTISRMEGTFYCPDYNTICTKNSPCKDSLDCINKKVAYQIKNYDYSVNSSLINPRFTVESDALIINITKPEIIEINENLQDFILIKIHFYGIYLLIYFALFN